jgi:hypothetical protein
VTGCIETDRGVPVTIDIGEVINHTWQITWKNKVLWVFGMVVGLVFSIIIPLATVPAFLPMLMRNSDMRFTPLFGGAYFVILALVMLVMYPLSVITQTSITMGVLHLEQENESLSLMEMVKRGLPFFWRVLGLMVLFAATIMFVNLVIQVLIFLLMIITFGLGMICAVPLILLMYPAIFLMTLWMEQSMNGIVIDGMTIVDAIKQGWRLIRNNLLPVGLMAIVIYFGVGMISSSIVMPMMLPLFAVPFGLFDGDVNWTILAISLAVEVVFLPLFVLIFGWSFAFTKSAWVLTYLRLTRSHEKTSPELQEAIS